MKIETGTKNSLNQEDRQMDYMAIGEKHAALYAKCFKENTEGRRQERMEEVAICLAKARVRILGLIGAKAALYQAGFLKGLGL